MESDDLALIEERLKSLREIMDAHFESLEKALGLQAKEYERRLNELNGEQSRLREERGRFLPRELYDSFSSDTNKWRDNVNTFIAGSSGQTQGFDKAWATIIAVVSSFITAVVTWLTVKR